MAKTTKKESDFINLSDKPTGKDGLPIGTKCADDCLRPIRSQAHCSVCHFSWSGYTLFDKHRLGGRCLKPESLGLVEWNGLWTSPEGLEQKDQAAAMGRARKNKKL